MAATGERRPGRRGQRRRLSRSADFDRVFREGRSYSTRHLVLHAFPRESDGGRPSGDEDGPRLGVSVGRRVGNAVERNRVKRLLREAFWAVAPALASGHDFVIVARADVAAITRDGGEAAVEAAVRELAADAGLAT